MGGVRRLVQHITITRCALPHYSFNVTPFFVVKLTFDTPKLEKLAYPLRSSYLLFSIIVEERQKNRPTSFAKPPKEKKEMKQNASVAKSLAVSSVFVFHHGRQLIATIVARVPDSQVSKEKLYEPPSIDIADPVAAPFFAKLISRFSKSTRTRTTGSGFRTYVLG